MGEVAKPAVRGEGSKGSKALQNLTLASALYLVNPSNRKTHFPKLKKTHFDVSTTVRIT